MTRADDFRRTTRSGVRIGRPTLVLHARLVPGDGVRVGFVVSKAVGRAVVRNRVRRRLRHLVAEQIGGGGGGFDLVVRALPAAVEHPAALGPDLGQAWDKALRRLGRAVPSSPATVGVQGSPA